MESHLVQIQLILQKMLGLHRQLLEIVRAEKEALTNADLQGIQQATYQKEGLIEAIRQQEALRIRETTLLAIVLKKPLKDLTLPQIVIAGQGVFPRLAEQLRTTFNALSILIERISDQNAYNLGLIEKSLGHVFEMKRNVLGESVPRSDTYNLKAQKTNTINGSRLISREA